VCLKNQGGFYLYNKEPSKKERLAKDEKSVGFVGFIGFYGTNPPSKMFVI